MAKHLAEGRAFPVFWYGQSYMLAVESWLAAPLFLVFGSSVTALKLPLLAINCAIGYLLLRGFARDAGLAPLHAVVPTLFFALPAAGTAARLVEANGGNVEPFLYVLLIWTLRDRPMWCGVVFGLGFLHREFTLYGFAALVAIELRATRPAQRSGAPPARRHGRGRGWRLGFRAVDQAILVRRRPRHVARRRLSVQRQHHASSPTASASIRSTAATGLLQARDRALAGALRHAAGTTPRFRHRDQRCTQGLPLSGVAARGHRRWRHAVGIAFSRRLRGLEFCAFLVLTALFSITGYVVGRCGAIDFYYMRYELLSLLGAAGLAGWFLAADPQRPVRRAWLALVFAWFTIVAIPHVQLWNEYLRHPPEDIRRTLIAHLDARGVRYAASRYWVAYALTFLTDERIVVKSSDFVRIREYEKIVDAHAAEMVRIERDPCPGGEE